MQTHLFCIPFNTGDGTSSPAAGKSTAKDTSSSGSALDASFPLELLQIAGESETESLSGISELVLHPFVPGTRIRPTGETTSNPVESAIVPPSAIAEDQQTPGDQTAVVPAAARPAEPVSLGFEADDIAQPENLSSSGSGPITEGTAERETRDATSAGRESPRFDAGAIRADNGLFSTGDSAAMSRGGFVSMQGAVGSDLARDVVTRSAEPVSAEAGLNQPHRSKPAEAVAHFGGRGQVDLRPDTGAGDESPSLPERTDAMRSGVAGKANPVSLPGEPRPAVDGAPSVMNEPKDGKDHGKSPGTTVASATSGDRIPIEKPETAPERNASEVGSRSSTTTTGDGRALVSTAEPPIFAEQLAKLEKPDPTAVIGQIVRKAVIRAPIE